MIKWIWLSKWKFSITKNIVTQFAWNLNTDFYFSSYVRVWSKSQYLFFNQRNLILYCRQFSAFVFSLNNKGVFVWLNDANIFSPSIKVGTYYITGQRGEVKCYLILLCNFLAFFVVFYYKISVFIILISFFAKLSNFRNRILNNQKHELVVSNSQWSCMTRSASQRNAACKRNR